MNKLISGTKKIHLFALLLVMVSYSAYCQQGLFLSQRKDAPKIENIFRADLAGWYQPQRDRHAFGTSFTYSPYFAKYRAELRIKAGYQVSNDKQNNAEGITTYLITPGSPGIEMGAGYTQLLSSADDSDFEMAFNADFFCATRFLSLRQTPYSSDGHYKFRISSYHLRGGFEIIPIPHRLSFYGNANFLLGVSGREQYLLTSEEDLGLLQKAEYIDAGVKLMIRLGDCFIITPDINFIFAEKRMRDRMPGGDSVIPTLKLDVTFLIPSKK